MRRSVRPRMFMRMCLRKRTRGMRNIGKLVLSADKVRAGAGITVIPPRLFAFVVFSFPVLLARSVLLGHVTPCSEPWNSVLLFQIDGIHVNDHLLFLLRWSYRGAPFLLFAHFLLSPIIIQLLRISFNQVKNLLCILPAYSDSI